MGGKVPHAALFIKGCFSTLPMPEDETAQRRDGGCSHSPSFLGSVAPRLPPRC